MKRVLDLILILAWMYVVANGIHYNWFVIVISIIFWLSDEELIRYIKEEK